MSFLACHEKIDVRGNSLHRTEKFIGKFKSDFFLLKQNVFLPMHISLRRHSTNLFVYLFIFFSFCLKLNFLSLQLKFCLGQWFMKFAVKLVMVVGEFFTTFVIFFKNLIYMTSIIIYIIFCILFQRQSPVDVL